MWCRRTAFSPPRLTPPAIYLHWWDFIGAFQNIGEGLFASVVNIRSKRARGSKLDKAEAAFARENADLIGSTAGRMTAEEEEFFMRLGVT